ncbi:hypothetical protein BDF19DRAFT_435367 [Syncephalis fuscata]|nr:hypothetical protein BDF19DRAFT_435367 [Syncephalis fuscata]
MSEPSTSPIDGEDEAEICRVCRCEATPDQPLFHPCRCSGSIKYVHEDCLKEWLSRSGKRHCELCKFQFSFTRVYREDMPKTIPLTLLIRCAIERIFQSFAFGLRILLASTVWLIALPYITVWSLRTLLWSGENVAFGLSGAQLPAHIAQLREKEYMAYMANSTYNGPNGLWYALIDAAMYGIVTGGQKNVSLLNNTTTTTTSNTTQIQAVDERQLIVVVSRFFADCFEGQIIACLVVVVFVAGFLLREWILQNTPPLNYKYPRTCTAPPPPEQGNAAVMAQVRAELAYLVQTRNEMEMLMANQHEAPKTIRKSKTAKWPTKSISSRPRTACGRYTSNFNRRYRLLRIARLSNSPQHQRPFNVIHRTLPTDIHQKKDQAQVTTWISTGDETTGKMSHFVFKESDQPPIQHKWPNSRCTVTGKAWSVHVHWAVARRSPRRAVFSKYCRQCKMNHTVSTSKRYGPRRGWSIQLYPNKMASVWHNGDIAYSNNSQNESIYDINDQQQQQQQDFGEVIVKDQLVDPFMGDMDINEPIPDELRDNFLDREGAFRRTIDNETHFLNAARPASPPMEDEPLLEENEEEEEEQEEEQENEGLQLPLRADNNHQVEADILNEEEERAEEQINNILPDSSDEEGDEGEDEEDNGQFDGVLEAMGIRGPIGLLFQNAALMTILVMLALACAAWMPYIVGKTFVLMSPLDYITLPLRILRLITDPIVDFTLDVWLPLCWRISLFLLRPFLWLTTLFIHVMTLLVYYTQQVTSRLLTFDTISTSTTMPWLNDYLTQQSTWLINTSNEVIELVHTQGRQWIEAFTQHAIQVDSTLNDPSKATHLPISAAANATFSMAGWLLGGDPNHETVIKLQERWQSFAYGNTPADNFLSVAIGYMVIGFDLILYLAYTRNAYGHAVGNAMQQGFLMAAMVVKVIFFVIIELVVFPTACGILLDFATLPLFSGVTIFTRIEFQLDAPFTSVFLHWFVGTGFMFFFSNFIITCRKVVRPGVMWFIRDPNDPRFHPMKEILERTAWVQLRKVAASGLMYMGIIVICFGGVIYAIDRLTTTILPLKWTLDKPISDFPIDLLVLHLVVPIVVTWARPKRHFRIYFAAWWKAVSYLLRLSSFMFGGRHPEEEVIERWINEEDKAETRLVGRLVLAPSYDSIPVWLDRSVFIPVNEAGEPLNTEDQSLIDDSVAPEQRGIIVYLPTYFRTRICLFLFLMWLTGTLIGVTFTVGPLLLGRFMCERWITHRAEHDIYAFFTGISTISIAICLVDMLLQMKSFVKQMRRMRWRRTFRIIFRYTFLVIQILSLCIVFGVVIPYLLSITIKRCLLLPILTQQDKRNYVIILLQDWALGILYCKMAIQVALLFPNNFINRAVTRILTGNVAEWNTFDAMIYFALPIVSMLCFFLAAPYIFGPLILRIFHYWGMGGEVVEKQFYLLAYPVEMLALLTVGLYHFGSIVIKRWVTGVFEEEFLVGERLHNYSDASVAVEEMTAH